MSKRLAIVTTLAGSLFLNSFAVAAITDTVAKDTKKHDKKPAVALSVASKERSEEKKKDDEKKQELAVNEYQPALMKPASLRHFEMTHRHHRSQRIS